MQTTFLTTKVLHEIDASTFGIDGKDLKVIGRAGDGYDYAMKRVEDNPSLPLTEWVAYCLYKKCGISIPDFAILDRGLIPPAFGSRWIQEPIQISEGNLDAYSITNFFNDVKVQLSSIYPIDAFYVNSDRHGRNLIKQNQLTSVNLYTIDFSRSWIINGFPFGDINRLVNSQTQKWWKFFYKNMKISPSFDNLEKIVTELSDSWIRTTIMLSPEEWRNSINIDAIEEFWIKERSKRVDYAKSWVNK
jgi:hypothetical protein